VQIREKDKKEQEQKDEAMELRNIMKSFII
jgi:thiamine monophosphate synthase